MTNDRCIRHCRDNDFSIAGTEDGFQCFCGDVLVDSMLLDDSRCNMTCDGGTGRFCGGPWALSLWSADGKVAQVPGPQHQFSLPQPAPGSADVTVHPGGIILTVVAVTTALDIWPPPMATAIVRKLAVSSSTISTISTKGLPSISNSYNEDIVSPFTALTSTAVPGEYLAAESKLLRANQGDGRIQTLVKDKLQSIGQDVAEFVARLYSGPTSFMEPLRTGIITPRPSAHESFPKSAHDLATPTPPADPSLTGATTRPSTSLDLFLAVQSPTEHGLLSTYTGGATTTTTSLRYRGFIGQYRGAMPFIA
ncbi:hypothetical protein BR93DRAFT_979339 [Coniochaeta sp. PMI_546]|nr:hypothetical protein BR93DRAFT_979339 [Coniochaeta sp. PMI_546]